MNDFLAEIKKAFSYLIYSAFCNEIVGNTAVSSFFLGVFYPLHYFMQRLKQLNENEVGVRTRGFPSVIVY